MPSASGPPATACVDGGGEYDVGGHENFGPEEERMRNTPPRFCEVSVALVPSGCSLCHRIGATEGSDRHAHRLEDPGDLLYHVLRAGRGMRLTLVLRRDGWRAVQAVRRTSGAPSATARSRDDDGCCRRSISSSPASSPFRSADLSWAGVHLLHLGAERRCCHPQGAPHCLWPDRPWRGPRRGCHSGSP